ncbi:MAG: PopZ family protein [Pseudomonadota bacterium]|jgi:cell pole-organizing protein PopZ
MTQAAKAQEPSMEEILASIRRIIADDEAKPVAGEAAPAKPEPAPARSQAVAPQPAKAAPPPAPPPSKASNSQDDIDAMLASLDVDTAASEVRPAPPAEPEPEADDVFELTEQMAVSERAQPVVADDDLEFSEPPPAREEQVRARAYEPPPAAPPEPAPMLSNSTVFAVESAFNSLAHTVLSNNARTLEDLVKEMLRPMLKSWLDDNLPGLVERIVKAEIERVSRGGR